VAGNKLIEQFLPAHLTPLVDYADLDGHLLIDNDPYEGVKVENGKLILPDGPGLGVKAR